MKEIKWAKRFDNWVQRSEIHEALIGVIILAIVFSLLSAIGAF